MRVQATLQHGSGDLRTSVAGGAGLAAASDGIAAQDIFFV